MDGEAILKRCSDINHYLYKLLLALPLQTNSGIFHLFAYLEIKIYIEREKAGHGKKRYSEEIAQASEHTSAIT